MKILIYTDYLRHTSGYAREIRDLLPYLNEPPFEIRFVGLGYNGFPPEFDFEVYAADVDEASDYWAIEVLDYAIKDFQPDIILSLQDFFMTRKIAFALSIPGKHKWIHWGTLDGDPSDHYSREALRWLDYTLYHSKASKIEVEKVVKGIQGEVLYPPINPQTWKPISSKEIAQYKQEYGISNKDKVLITCGRNQQRKNIPVLLDAMVDIKKKIPNIKLILVSGVQTMTQNKGKSKRVDGYDYDAFIRERGLQNNIIDLRTEDYKSQSITDKRLNILYNISDLMVHPSWGEGFGLPIAEAGLVGLPTIGVDHSAVSEVVGKGGMLIPWRAYIYTQAGFKQHMCHPDDITDAVVKYFNLSKQEQNKMKNAAKKFAEELKPIKVAKQLIKVFEDVENKKSIAKTELNI